MRRQTGCGKKTRMDEPSSPRPDPSEPTGIATIPKILGWALRIAVVVFGAVLIAVAVALLVDDSRDVIQFLHRVAMKIRLVLMVVLLALAAHVAFCNAWLLRDNLRNKASHSLIPLLGLAFGAAACLAAPAGSVWRWVAVGITLADTGTWITVWTLGALLGQFALSVAGSRRRRQR